MENESIYDISSSEFDSIPDVVDSLGPESVAEQDPAEQEQPEQEEQGSADSSEPDTSTDDEIEQGSVDSSEPDTITDVESEHGNDDSSYLAELVENTSSISDKLDNIYSVQMYTLQAGLLLFGVVLAVALGRWIYRITNINF